MKLRLIVVALATLACTSFAVDEPPAPQPPIRTFPIPTIEALGKELYHRDQLAAAAFDLLFAAHPEAKAIHIRGWITQADEEHQRVFFVMEKDGTDALAYIVAFPQSGSPQIIDRHGDPLPDFVATRFAARRAAFAAAPKLMTDRYNSEVLDDPERKGSFLVYLLAATLNPDEVIVGGHYRITVAADGKKVEQVDALSRSFLVLRRSDTPKDSELKAFEMSHVVSNTPVETHVFANLLCHIPFVVITMNHKLWRIDKGAIGEIEWKESSPAPKP